MGAYARWAALGERPALIEAGPILGTEPQTDERCERERDCGESEHAISIGPCEPSLYT